MLTFSGSYHEQILLDIFRLFLYYVSNKALYAMPQDLETAVVKNGRVILSLLNAGAEDVCPYF